MGTDDSPNVTDDAADEIMDRIVKSATQVPSQRVVPRERKRSRANRKSCKCLGHSRVTPSPYPVAPAHPILGKSRGSWDQIQWILRSAWRVHLLGNERLKVWKFKMVIMKSACHFQLACLGESEILGYSGPPYSIFIDWQLPIIQFCGFSQGAIRVSLSKMIHFPIDS